MMGGNKYRHAFSNEIYVYFLFFVVWFEGLDDGRQRSNHVILEFNGFPQLLLGPLTLTNIL